MIRIRLAHGDRSVELTADGELTVDSDAPALTHAINAARNLWAVVIAAGPATPPDPDPPRVEAGGMGFTADLDAPHRPEWWGPGKDGDAPRA